MPWARYRLSTGAHVSLAYQPDNATLLEAEPALDEIGNPRPPTYPTVPKTLQLQEAVEEIPAEPVPEVVTAEPVVESPAVELPPTETYQEFL